MRRYSLVALLLVALVTAAACASTEEGRGGVEQGAAVPAQGAMEEGMGGAATAPGLSASQLGPCSWVISGQAAAVMPDQNKITLSTDKGEQPLDITAQTKVRDEMANDIALSDIQPGDRVVASFHRENGQNIVGHLYRLPPEEGMGGAPLEEDMGEGQGMGQPGMGQPGMGGEPY